MLTALRGLNSNASTSPSKSSETRFVAIRKQRQRELQKFNPKTNESHELQTPQSQKLSQNNCGSNVLVTRIYGRGRGLSIHGAE